MVLFIKSPIGNGLKSDQKDVRKVRAELIKLGFSDKNPEHGYIDSTLDRNIRLFQKDNGLMVDGVLFPEGKQKQRCGQLWCGHQ